MAFEQSATPSARFFTNGALTAELLGTRITIDYDPVIQTSSALFDGQLYLPVDNGGYQQLAGYHDTLKIDFTGQLARRYANEVGLPLLDPVTGANLADVSVAGVMMLIKAAYDIEVNSRYEAEHPVAEEPPAG